MRSRHLCWILTGPSFAVHHSYFSFSLSDHCVGLSMQAEGKGEQGQVRRQQNKCGLLLIYFFYDSHKCSIRSFDWTREKEKDRDWAQTDICITSLIEIPMEMKTLNDLPYQTALGKSSLYSKSEWKLGGEGAGF